MLPAVALTLAVATVPFVLVLVARRWQLERRERTTERLGKRMTPLALALVDGETDGADWKLGRGEGEAIAAVLGRYSRLLSGEARVRIATFFEERGLVLASCRDATSAPSSWHRARAAGLLGEMASPSAIQSLLACLEDRDRNVRSAAARSLARLRATEAATPLVHALVDGRVPHLVAANALLEIGPPILPPLEPLVDDDQEEVRVAALELMAQLGNAGHGDMLIARLRDPVAEVRARACRAVGRVGASAAATQLRGALADPVPSVRAAAAVALGEIGDTDAADALAEQAAVDEFAPARYAARALARIAPQRVTELGRAPAASAHLRETADRVALGML